MSVDTATTPVLPPTAVVAEAVAAKERILRYMKHPHQYPGYLMPEFTADAIKVADAFHAATVADAPRVGEVGARIDAGFLIECGFGQEDPASEVFSLVDADGRELKWRFRQDGSAEYDPTLTYLDQEGDAVLIPTPPDRAEFRLALRVLRFEPTN